MSKSPIVVCLFNNKQFEDAPDKSIKSFCIIQTLANSMDIVAHWSKHEYSPWFQEMKLETELCHC